MSESKTEESFDDFIDRMDRENKEEEARIREAQALEERRRRAEQMRDAFLDEHPNGRKSEGALRGALRF